MKTFKSYCFGSEVFKSRSDKCLKWHSWRCLEKMGRSRRGLLNIAYEGIWGLHFSRRRCALDPVLISHYMSKLGCRQALIIADQEPWTRWSSKGRLSPLVFCHWNECLKMRLFSAGKKEARKLTSLGSCKLWLCGLERKSLGMGNARFCLLQYFV